MQDSQIQRLQPRKLEELGDCKECLNNCKDCNNRHPTDDLCVFLFLTGCKR